MQNNQQQRPNINPSAAKWWAARRKRSVNAETYVKGILEGNKVLLGQAITLVESEVETHAALAQKIIAGCLPHADKSIRIGITGSPGVGKSTFIESFGLHLIEQGHKVGVLAIDPSSKLSRGSILGDKTRMAELSNHAASYIRPSAAGDSLGGVARKTRETIILCEAAGYDVILVETVGVGQSEVAVHSMVDFFLLLLLPGGGDELQGIKRGIVEMADLLAVNKAEGERADLANQTLRAYKNAVHLFPPKKSGWIVKTLKCSGLTGFGVDDVWKAIQKFQTLTKENGYFKTHREKQLLSWMHETIEDALKKHFFNHPNVSKKLIEAESKVSEGKISPFKAAEELLKFYLP